MAASRFKSKSGIHLFGKIRRTDWLPVRDTKEAMDQDQLHRSEESASDYDSEEEEAMAIPRHYDDEYQDSISGESSDLYDFDAEAMAEDYARTDAYFAGLRALRQSPGYKPTGTPIRND